MQDNKRILCMLEITILNLKSQYNNYKKYFEKLKPQKYFLFNQLYINVKTTLSCHN